MRVLVSLILVCTLQSLYGQTPFMDSLLLRLNSHTLNDTNKVSLLTTISSNAWGIDPEKTKYYAEQALKLAEDLGYTKGIGDSYRGIARYYWSQTEYDHSMDYSLKALKAYEKCHNLEGQAWCYGTIGLNYSQANNYEKAIHYHTVSLAINERINNTNGLARDLNNLGYVYELAKDYVRSLDYYQRALDIRIILGDKFSIAQSHGNVGSIHLYNGNYSLALEYLFKALTASKELNNKNSIAVLEQNIGEVYYKMGKHQEGAEYLQHALTIAFEIGDKKRMEGVYEALKRLEESRKNFKEALRYLELLQQVRDTLYTQARSLQMADMEARYETAKKEQTITLLEQEKRIQTIWQNVLAGGIVLLIIATLIIVKLQRLRTLKAKELLEIQQSLNDKLKEIDKMKSRFFANISHEFRTPLTLLLAPIEEQLASCQSSGKQKESLLLMRRNANRLLELVNQLLDLSKLEAGKMQLAVKQGDLEELLKILIISFDSLADSKKITYIKNFKIPPGEYWYDADALEKILNNLLSNAFKFTPAQGTVTVTIENAAAIATKGSWIKLCVADTGKGIAQDEQEKIFSPFYQGKHTMDGSIGTGLGLSLVKEFTKLYGGYVTLTSQEREGTIIEVYLPVGRENFNAIECSHSILPTQIAVNGAHNPLIEENDDENIVQGSVRPNHDVILVVEDNEDLRNFMSSILQDEYTVVTASNGKDGVEQALVHIPSLIISDVMMPVMEGTELTEKIKTDHRTSHIPVILLTAKNEQTSRLAGYKNGADDFLTKPFSTEELRVRIANLIDQRKLLAAKYKERITVLPTSMCEASLDEKFLQRARVVVERNIGDFTFGVESMASEMNLSRTQLLRKIKALTGLSTNEFIKDLRLKRAAELILAKANTITQVGYTVGFNDQSYFTKCFKKQFGVAPSEYHFDIKS
jgi:signal transduction histidine kinase/DNA-binding response OmpR family regulator